MTTDYDKFLKKAADRRAEVVKLAAQKRWSHREIGLKMKPPITPQRVRQILRQEGVI